MYIYKYGDRCPCCGQVLEGKSEDWLALFSLTVAVLEIPDLYRDDDANGDYSD